MCTVFSKKAKKSSSVLVGNGAPSTEHRALALREMSFTNGAICPLKLRFMFRERRRKIFQQIAFGNLLCAGMWRHQGLLSACVAYRSVLSSTMLTLFK